MSNEPKDPQPKPNALLGVAYRAKPSSTRVAQPGVGHVEEHGIQPVAYVPPPVKPPTGDGGAEMVSEWETRGIRAPRQELRLRPPSTMRTFRDGQQT